jgi:hypothetical protein
MSARDVLPDGAALGARIAALEAETELGALGESGKVKLVKPGIAGAPADDDTWA